MERQLTVFVLFLFCMTGCNVGNAPKANAIEVSSQSTIAEIPNPTTPEEDMPPVDPTDRDGDNLFDSYDPCPTDPLNNCRIAIPISNSTELTLALQNATGGEHFALAPGNYGRLEIEYRDFLQPVLIKSSNIADKASFSELKISTSSNIVMDSLLFDYVFSEGDGAAVTRFSVRTSNNVAIINSVFDGDEAFGTDTFADGIGSGRGLKVGDTSRDINLINNEFKTWWKGLNIGKTVNINFIGNEIHDIRSDGLNLGQVNNVLIARNYFHDFRSNPGTNDHRDMIQILRSSGIGSSNIVFRNNIFDTARGDYAQTIWSGTDGSEARLSNVIVENNILYASHANGIALHSVDGLQILNNTMIKAERSDGEGAASKPKIISSNSTNVVVQFNISPGIANPQPDWLLSNNVIVQNTDSQETGFYSDEFIFYSYSPTEENNEFGIKPGSLIETEKAGSSLMNLYPIGKSQTMEALRNL